MLKKIYKNIVGLAYFLLNVKRFRANKIFKNKRVVIIGAADSAFRYKLKSYIEDFDFIIRLNKAIVSWNPDHDEYVGKRTDILFHGFVENMDRGGGGPLDLALFKKFGVKYLVQPRFDRDGVRNMINFYKKYLAKDVTTYALGFKDYRKIKVKFGNYHPTKGFNALNTVLESNCKEVAIIGFTFFKTPYAVGYRDNIRDVESNLKHIADQGLHDVDKEYQNFLKLVEKFYTTKKIWVDPVLYEILLQENKQFRNMVLKIETE